MTSANNEAAPEAQLCALIDDGVKAIRAKDVDGALSNYTPRPLVRHRQPAAARWIGQLQKAPLGVVLFVPGPIGYELGDLTVAAGDDVAFSQSLNRVNATTTAGTRLDMWWRATVCYRRIDGKWMVTHAHSSVPFDVESGRASLDLKP
jgi:ketosteroid isomerase-like protein